MHVCAPVPDLGDVIDEGAAVLVIDVKLDVHDRHVDLGNVVGW